jgi:pimeloyl-ACP methyl ester carboxylesterase
VVLLHGFAASVFSWREVMGPLAESHTVVAIDRPGFGLTERPCPASGRIRAA